MSITVITTGGTIGAQAYPDPARPPAYSRMPSSDPVIEFLHQSYSDVDFVHIPLPPVDSKQIDSAYRRDIQKKITSSSTNNILLTHGTDTILNTADELHSQLPDSKRLIITGAMTPLLNGTEHSDGHQNLRYAVDQLLKAPEAQGVNAGLYIVLSNYAKEDPESWQPHLVLHEPGNLEKYHDPTNGARSRLVPAKRREPTSPLIPR